VVGSLLLGLYDNGGTLRHVGVASSFEMAERAALAHELAARAVDLDTHPWSGGFATEGAPMGRLRGAAGRWTPDMALDWVPVTPELVCEVAYDRADGNRFRHPARFRRWRPDRTASSCTSTSSTRSTLAAAPMAADAPSASEVTVEVAGRAVRLTTLDRMLVPAAGVHKAAMVAYYAAVAPVLLPHLASRPVTLHRFPEGVGGPHFFQTRCPPHPEWVRRQRMYEAGLLWAANLSALEFHPYLACAEDLTRPLVAVFDLDLREPATLLDALGLASWAKTSGGLGLHVYVPFNRPITYVETKALARAVAADLTARHPETVTDVMSRTGHERKVFIDWSPARRPPAYR